MDGDNIGASTAEIDVVDDLLSRWTNLSKTEFEKARIANVTQNIKKLRRID